MSNNVCYPFNVSVTDYFSQEFFYLPTKQKTSVEWNNSGHRVDNFEYKKTNVQCTKWGKFSEFFFLYSYFLLIIRILCMNKKNEYFT